MVKFMGPAPYSVKGDLSKSVVTIATASSNPAVLPASKASFWTSSIHFSHV